MTQFDWVSFHLLLDCQCVISAKHKSHRLLILRFVLTQTSCPRAPSSAPLLALNVNLQNKAGAGRPGPKSGRIAFCRTRRGSHPAGTLPAAPNRDATMCFLPGGRHYTRPTRLRTRALIRYAPVKRHVRDQSSFDNWQWICID